MGCWGMEDKRNGDFFFKYMKQIDDMPNNCSYSALLHAIIISHWNVQHCLIYYYYYYYY